MNWYRNKFTTVLRHPVWFIKIIPPAMKLAWKQTYGKKERRDDI